MDDLIKEMLNNLNSMESQAPALENMKDKLLSQKAAEAAAKEEIMNAPESTGSKIFRYGAPILNAIAFLSDATGPKGSSRRALASSKLDRNIADLENIRKGDKAKKEKALKDKLETIRRSAMFDKAVSDIDLEAIQSRNSSRGAKIQGLSNVASTKSSLASAKNSKAISKQRESSLKMLKDAHNLRRENRNLSDADFYMKYPDAGAILGIQSPGKPKTAGDIKIELRKIARKEVLEEYPRPKRADYMSDKDYEKAKNKWEKNLESRILDRMREINSYYIEQQGGNGSGVSIFDVGANNGQGWLDDIFTKTIQQRMLEKNRGIMEYFTNPAMSPAVADALRR